MGKQPYLLRLHSILDCKSTLKEGSHGQKYPLETRYHTLDLVAKPIERYFINRNDHINGSLTVYTHPRKSHLAHGCFIRGCGWDRCVSLGYQYAWLACCYALYSWPGDRLPNGSVRAVALAMGI
jgi:hypothetical protein